MGRTPLTMQENQQAAVGVMEKIHEICQQLGLRYTLTFGTLIGAIRHKGYIPWDDDLDIMMPRADYDRFAQWCLSHAEELLPFKLYTPETVADYPYMLPRLCDTRYEIETDNEKNCGMGAFVDIYPLDGIGKTPEEAKAVLQSRSRLVSLYFLSTRLRCEKGLTTSKLKRLVKLPAFWLAKLIGQKRLGQKIEKIAAGCDYDASQYVGCVIWETAVEKGLYPKEWFTSFELTEYEGRQFYVISEYDALLRMGYGDYMQLPPEEDRIPHHFYDIYKK